MSKQAPDINTCLEESWDLIQDLRSLLFGPDQHGNLWMPAGGAAPGTAPSLIYFLRTPYFNRLQRWQSQFLAKTCGYAKSAVSNLVNMVWGSGFKYTHARQDELDAWMEAVKWDWRSRERLRKLITDGESFDRLFGVEEGDGVNLTHADLRFVDPDQVYDEQDSGIVCLPDDYETVVSYVIGGKPVSASEIQHRKLAWAEEKRGTSILFPVIQHLVNAEQLCFNLSRSIDQQVRFAAIRTHEAPQAGVQAFKSDIRATQNAQYGPEYDMHFGMGVEHIERYKAGTILDLSTGTKMEFPSRLIDGDKAVTVLRAVLRLVAASVGLPENVLSQDQDSMAAYTASLVADSHCVKGLEAWQHMLIEWDKELLAMCGFEDVEIEPGEVAIHQKDVQVKVGEMLLDKGLASKQTVAKSFDVDYDAEKEQIEKDQAADMDRQKELMAAQPEENKSQGLNKGEDGNTR